MATPVEGGGAFMLAWITFLWRWMDGLEAERETLPRNWDKLLEETALKKVKNMWLYFVNHVVSESYSCV